MFGCIFIQALWIWGEQTATDKEKEEEDSGGRLKELFLHDLFLPLTGTSGVILFVSFSHSSSSSSSSFLSHFWIMLSRVWLEGEAPGRCKSGEGCWHRRKTVKDLKWKSLSPYPSGLLLKVDLDLCACARTLSVLGVGPLASPPASHVKRAQEQKCLLGEYHCLCGRSTGGGGVGMDGRGGLFVDYQSSVWVLFHLCQLYLILNWLSSAVIS